MQMLATFVRFEIGFLMGSLILVVGYLMLTGKIHTVGLLWDSLKQGKLSMERVQLLVFTLVGAAYYLGQTLQDPSHFPAPPRELVVLFGGSNLYYLGRKFLSLLSFRNQR